MKRDARSLQVICIRSFVYSYYISLEHLNMSKKCYIYLILYDFSYIVEWAA